MAELMTVRLAELVSARLSDGRRVQRARGFRDSRHVLELFRKKKGHQGGLSYRRNGRVLCHRGAARNPNDTITIGALIYARRAGQTCLLPSVRTPLPLR